MSEAHGIELLLEVWEQNIEALRHAYLWLLVLVFVFMLYGLYVWGLYPLKK